MESLASYYSDEEEELSTIDTTMKPEPPCTTEDNYDPVGMEMSDDDESQQDPGTFLAHPLKSKDGSEDHRGMSERTKSVSHTSPKTSHETSDRARNQKNDLNRWRTKSQNMSSKTRSPHRISRSRSRSRSRSEIKSESYSRSSSRSKSQSPNRSRSRSRSIDRYRIGSRSPRDRREHYHKRSGNGERYRDRSPHRRPYDRVAANKMCILEKLGIELKVPEKEKTGSKYFDTFGQNSSRFLEQIAKRKLLWNKNQKVNPTIDADKVEPPSKINQWKDARFSQDQDGKMTAKFHRLMGMKTAGGTSSSNESDKETTSIKQQEELFSTMEMQYEAARNATHKQRGVGLGFSSHHLTR